MMWAVLAFMSAALLGCYDFFKKVSLKDNSVIAVLFLNTLFYHIGETTVDVQIRTTPSTLPGIEKLWGQHRVQSP